MSEKVRVYEVRRQAKHRGKEETVGVYGIYGEAVRAMRSLEATNITAHRFRVQTTAHQAKPSEAEEER